jgi:hypothetical protein
LFDFAQTRQAFSLELEALITRVCML